MLEQIALIIIVAWALMSFFGVWWYAISRMGLLWGITVGWVPATIATLVTSGLIAGTFSLAGDSDLLNALLALLFAGIFVGIAMFFGNFLDDELDKRLFGPHILKKWLGEKDKESDVD